MQMFKIVTLGKSFVIVNRGFLSDESSVLVKKGVRIEEGGIRVEISQDMEYDYRIMIPNSEMFFGPDVDRALHVFLYYLMGYPKTDFELFFENTCKKINIPEFCGRYGGNVGKCKLLYSNMSQNSQDHISDINLVKSPFGGYAAVVCDNPGTVDLSKIISSVIRESSCEVHIRGAIAISFFSDEAKIAVKYIDGSLGADSTAFAVAHYLLKNLFDKDAKIIRSENDFAECESDELGVYVYDPLPKIYRLL